MFTKQVFGPGRSQIAGPEIAGQEPNPSFRTLQVLGPGTVEARSNNDEFCVSIRGSRSDAVPLRPEPESA
jgi:hypothetical protein